MKLSLDSFTAALPYCDGQYLTTKTGRSTFMLTWRGEWPIEIVPSSGKPRFLNRNELQDLLDEYNKTNSLNTSDYTDISQNTSYFVALVQLIDGINSTIETVVGDPGTFIPDEEGREIIRKYTEYKRSRKNRAQAIQIHGTRCLACGFDFNAVYGDAWAREYIEIHHTRSIAEIDGPVDPEIDLIPLCSNCHSMAHRKTGKILAIEEIRRLITENEK